MRGASRLCSLICEHVDCNESNLGNLVRYRLRIQRTSRSEKHGFPIDIEPDHHSFSLRTQYETIFESPCLLQHDAGDNSVGTDRERVIRAVVKSDHVTWSMSNSSLHDRQIAKVPKKFELFVAKRSAVLNVLNQ
jgi:hypothetical protein